MAFTYAWNNADHTSLLRSDGWYIPVDPANRMYAEFLASGAVAADYTPPPELQRDL